MALLLTSDVLDWVPQAIGNEGLIGAAVDRAEGLASTYCDRSFGMQPLDEYYDVGLEQTALQLRGFPILAVTQVDENAQDAAPTTLTPDQYVRDDANGILHRAWTDEDDDLQIDQAYWSSGKQAVRVQYRAGYTAGNCPESLKVALLQLVAWIIGGRGDVGTTTDSLDGYSRTKERLKRGIPESVASMLDPYKRLW